MNGWVTIGTKLDTKQLEKDLKVAEGKLKQYEREGEKLATQKAKIEESGNLSGYFTSKQQYEDEIKAINQSNKGQAEKELLINSINNAMETLNSQYSKELGSYNRINQQIEENEKNQRNVKEEVKETKKELAGAYAEAQRNQTISTGFKGIRDTMKDIVKNAVRWGIAIFGIRSAYNFLRSSISTISQYNKQVGTDIEYIRFALASTLEPVVLRLISLVKTLLGYINYIAKAWFGVDLFAGASVDKFKQNEKSLGGSVKKAKELNKQIAGFDEMNVLQDNSDTGGGGGGAGGGATPSFDLSQFEGEVPDWLKWIADNRDLLLSVIAGITAGLLAWRLGLTAIQSLGIGIMIAGIVYTIMALIQYLKDPSWTNFGKVIQGIGVAIVGLGILIGGVPLIVAGAIVLIVGTIIKYWEEIKAKLVQAGNWLAEQGSKIRANLGKDIGDIYDTFVTMFKGIVVSLNATFNGLKNILNGIITFVKGVFTGNWKQAWEGVKKIFSGIVQSFNGIFFGVITLLSGTAKTIAVTIGATVRDTFRAIINAVISRIDGILNTPIIAINGLISAANKLPGVNVSRLRTISFPRLAKGGIVNMPGRGVPIGSAIAGERGAEGVIPLTDSQQMALLGEAIGKYITVNASITNTMNGRVISRELQKINNENDFAYNR